MVDNKRPIVYSDDETSFAFPMVSSKEGFKKKTKDFMEKALLVGLQLGQEKRWSIEDSLEELGRLADTAGAQVVDTMIQHRSHRDPAFLIA